MTARLTDGQTDGLRDGLRDRQTVGLRDGRQMKTARQAEIIRTSRLADGPAQRTIDMQTDTRTEYTCMLFGTHKMTDQQADAARQADATR